MSAHVDDFLIIVTNTENIMRKFEEKLGSGKGSKISGF